MLRHKDAHLLKVNSAICSSQAFNFAFLILILKVMNFKNYKYV
jgi:hypothetical protein